MSYRIIMAVTTETRNIIDGLMQDCSISTANALEILQSCTKPSIYRWSIALAHLANIQSRVLRHLAQIIVIYIRTSVHEAIRRLITKATSQY